MDIVAAPSPAATSAVSGPRRGHAVFRQLFVPALLAITAVSWVFHVELEGRLKATGFPIDYVSTVLLLSMTLIWVAEQAYPQNAMWNYRLVTGGGVRGWNLLARDLFYFFVVTQLSALLINVAAGRLRPLTDVGTALARRVPTWPHEAPFAARVVLAFFTVELCSYWLHRACHRFAFLWRFHSTHHVLEELNGVKSLRTHPVDNLFFYVARSAPLLLLGAGVDEIVAVTYFGPILSVLAHANISVAEGPLGVIINFPRYHAVHHSADEAESRSNFGCHTVLWDRLFGTFRSDAQRPVEIGVKPVGPRSLWQELGAPFFRR